MTQTTRQTKDEYDQEMRDTIDEIVEAVQKQVHHLTREETICLVAHRLLQGPIYGSGIVNDVAASGTIRLSDTILLRALAWFRSHGYVTIRDQRPVSRGRPRLLYAVAQRDRDTITPLAETWRNRYPDIL